MSAYLNILLFTIWSNIDLYLHSGKSSEFDSGLDLEYPADFGLTIDFDILGTLPKFAYVGIFYC